MGPLSPYRHTDTPNIIAIIKGPHRNRMFAVSRYQKIQRIALSLTVSDAIIRKRLMPWGSVNADISTFDAPGRFLDIENCTHVVAGDLWLAGKSHHRRSVVDIDRLA